MAVARPAAAAAAALLVLAALLAAPARAAMNTDRTLPTAGTTCVAQYDALVKEHYGKDAKCANLIKGMLSTSDPAKCPDADSAPGSAVQKCMGASEETSEAWEGFVKKCEVMNVANRQGEAEAAADRKPSCMPAFATIGDFEHWLMGHDMSKAGAPAATSGAAAPSAAGAAAALAVGAAAAVLAAF